MADERKIVIVLRTEGGNGSATGAAEEQEQESPAELSSKSTKIAIAAMAAKQILSTAVSEGLQWANYEIDKNLNLDDNYIAQREKNIALQLIGKAGSFASTIFGGATAGAIVGGPIGAAIGATLGLVQAVSSTVRENIQSYEQQDIMLRQMDAQLSYTRQRAGWSVSAASIGEDL